MGLFSKTTYAGQLTWEVIKSDCNDSMIANHMLIYRAKVPGGWLVTNSSAHKEGLGLTFMPDPNHEWTLDKVK